MAAGSRLAEELKDVSCDCRVADLDSMDSIVSEWSWPGLRMNSLQELSQDITDRTLLQTINAAKSVLHDNISIAKMNRHMRRQKCTTGKCSSPKIPAAQSVDDEEETLESVTCTDCSLHPGSLADSVEEDDDIKTVAASNQYSDHVAPGPALLTRRKGWRERPHTALETVSTAKPSRTRRKPKSAVTRKQMPVQRKPVPLPYQMYKYKRPDSNSIKRNYRQLWNEKGQLSKKDTEYIGESTSCAHVKVSKKCLRIDYILSLLFFMCRDPLRQIPARSFLSQPRPAARTKAVLF